MNRKDNPLRRNRQTKIVATLGPASDDPVMIRKLFEAGVDVFRLNFSHGSQADHGERLKAIRALEKETGRPIAVMADLQGPKLRIGTFRDDKVSLTIGQTFRLDGDKAPGDETRVYLPHPEILETLESGHEVLLDDGRVRLQVTGRENNALVTEVMAGSQLSNRKGFNVPNALLPLSALTDKDREDLRYALEIGVDWVALSFVQRPEDLSEPRRLIGGRAALMVKVEKPSAVEHIEELIELSDGIMVARGDLGVEMPAENVPTIQKHMIRSVRRAGKPVIVATQMLESMVTSAAPTRAEASDVATAVYDGTDAVMLSAETAAGQYPVEAVSIMNRIAQKVESDDLYHTVIRAEHPDPQHTTADAITAAARQIAETISAAAIVTYTTSGSTTLRAARERPQMPILCLTALSQTARRLVLSYGVHAVHTEDIDSFQQMVEKACRISLEEGIAGPGERLVITAGVPFGTPGSTNIVRIAWVER